MAPTFVVRGYHGTTATLAQAIVKQQKILVSANDYDWLGTGAYFFQDAPLQAWKWAAEWVANKAKDKPAVVSADLKLDHCLDLLDIGEWRYVQLAYQHWCASFPPGATLPAQTAPVLRTPNGTRIQVVSPVPPTGKRTGNNFVDCAVIRIVVRRFSVARRRRVINAVRGSFVQGQQLYENSYFFDHAHVQIAVRDPDAVASNFMLEDSRLLSRKYSLSAMTRWPV